MPDACEGATQALAQRRRRLPEDVRDLIERASVDETQAEQIGLAAPQGVGDVRKEGASGVTVGQMVDLGRRPVRRAREVEVRRRERAADALRPARARTDDVHEPVLQAPYDAGVVRDQRPHAHVAHERLQHERDGLPALEVVETQTAGHSQSACGAVEIVPRATHEVVRARFAVRIGDECAERAARLGMEQGHEFLRDRESLIEGRLSGGPDR